MCAVRSRGGRDIIHCDILKASFEGSLRRSSIAQRRAGEIVRETRNCPNIHDTGCSREPMDRKQAIGLTLGDRWAISPAPKCPGARHSLAERELPSATRVAGKLESTPPVRLRARL
jgi:hypothetical protein